MISQFRIGVTHLRIHIFGGIWVLSLLLASRGLAQEGASDTHSQTSIRLEDVTQASGIDFLHRHGGYGYAYLVEGVATGLATFDYDNDGWIDVYLLNGAWLKGTPNGPAPRNALYRNNGDFTFTDVTDEAGVGDTGYGLGVTIGDYDGDGDSDIYVNNFGPNVLYRNNGDKTFTDVTQEAGVANGDQVGAGAAFFDADADGDLDLYVGNYVDFTFENHVEILVKGRRYHAGPQYYQPVPDTLFRNDGNGGFTDISAESGIALHAGPSMGLICADLDSDGDVDVYVCNDGMANYLFLNDGLGRFSEEGLLSGVGCDFQGASNSSMGVDLGDYDGDGRLDIFTTNYQSELPVLYHNLGDGLYEDATTAARIDPSLFAHVNWGTAFADFELDGDQDLFVACGHFDQVENIDDRTSHKVRNFVLMNQGGKFVDVSSSCGSGLLAVESSRGLAVDDLDNDGDADVIIVNSNTTAAVLRNVSRRSGHWASIELRQPGMNRKAVGARIVMKTGAITQIREVIAGRGYQSFYGSREYFGLPASIQSAAAQVTWPDGTVQEFRLALDQHNVLLREDSN